MITNSTTNKGFTLGSSENESYINTYASYSEDENTYENNDDMDNSVYKKNIYLEKLIQKIKSLISWFDN